jgi:hypothetical protein
VERLWISCQEALGGFKIFGKRNVTLKFHKFIRKKKEIRQKHFDITKAFFHSDGDKDIT